MTSSLIVCLAFATLQAPLFPKEAWEKSLRVGLKNCGASLVDLPSLGEIPLFARPIERSRLDDLGTVLGREYRSIQGTHVFSRRWELDSLGQPDVGEALKAWIKGLSPDEAARLRKGERLGDMSPEARKIMLRLAIGQNPLLAGRILAGDPNYRVRLSPSLEAEVRTPDGKSRSLPLPDQALWGSSATLPNLVSQELPTLPVLPPEQAELAEGPINFGEGQVIALADAVLQANGVGKGEIVFDRRLKDGLLFVKGRFTFERFLAALREIGTVQPPGLAPSRQGKGLYENLVPKDAASGSGLEEAIGDRRERSVREAGKLSSGLGDMMRNLRLPENGFFRLRLVPTLWIEGPGSIELPGSTSMVGGRPVPVLGANRVGITLPP